MIGDLNETLKQFLIERIPLDPREVEIVFEAPDQEWTGGVSTPTINCYLYHIQENHHLRVLQWERQPATGGREGSRKRMPYRVELHYHLTVWATAIEDEHRLLWRMLSALLRYEVLPATVLKGALAGSEWPIPVSVAQPESLLKNPSDFWTSFEHFIKPGVGCVFTLPLDPEMIITEPLVFSRRVGLRPPDGGPVEAGRYSVGGYLRATAADRHGIPGRVVRLVEEDRRQETDVYGRYIFERLAPGRHTLEAEGAGGPVQHIITVPGPSYDLVLDAVSGPDT